MQDVTEIRKETLPVCAWCHYEYDPQTGDRIRHLSDSEFAEVESHGVCRVDAAEQLAAGLANFEHRTVDL